MTSAAFSQVTLAFHLIGLLFIIIAIYELIIRLLKSSKKGKIRGPIILFLLGLFIMLVPHLGDSYAEPFGHEPTPAIAPNTTPET